MPSTPTASGSGRSAEDETPSSTSPSSSHGIDTTLYRRMFNSDLEFGTCLRVLRSVALQLGFDPGFASLVQRHLHSPEPPTQPPSLTHREEMALSPFRRFEYVDTRLGIWIRDLQQAGEELGFDPNWPSMIARHLNITPTAPPSAASPSATDPPPRQLMAPPSAAVPRPSQATDHPSQAATPSRPEHPPASSSAQPTRSRDQTDPPPTPSFRGRGFIPAGIPPPPLPTLPSTPIAPRNTAATPTGSRTSLGLGLGYAAV